LQEHKIPFVGFKQLGANKQTYLVELDVSERSAIEYANHLSETGKVVWAQPSFYKLTRKLNTYYSSQWGLNNIGQYNGVQCRDINVIDAWNIGATGLGIKVAVLDEGVDLNDHPDLKNNLLQGYDATDAYYGGSDGSYGGNGCTGIEDAHGTCCSGIIASEDNNIGTKGVAYEAKIIPIRIFYTAHAYDNFMNCFEGSLADEHWIADGIYKAWHDYGADILSCSWRAGSPGDVINAELDYAVMHSRNSLGVVAVFAAGNSNNNEVAYPAELPNVIAVGAMSPCGERKSYISCDGENWGSNYGDMLDLVAPGVLIATTDIQGGEGYNPKFPIHTARGGSKVTNDFPDQDYTVWFSGTSSACPHVAGVAALILSVRPDLNQKQVRQAIESTCTKINEWSTSNPTGYIYEDNPVHPHGTWSEFVGHGLVNTYLAVNYAISIPPPNISGPDVICTSEDYTLNCNYQASNWSVTPTTAFQITSSNATLATVTTISNVPGTTGTLTAVVNGVSITKNIETYDADIIGSSVVCSIGIYTLDNNPQGTVWDVAPITDFEIIYSDDEMAIVSVIGAPGVAGMLTAEICGVVLSKTIESCQLSLSGSNTICYEVLYPNPQYSYPFYPNNVYTVASLPNYAANSYLTDLAGNIEWTCSNNLNMLTAPFPSLEASFTLKNPISGLTTAYPLPFLSTDITWVTATVNILGVLPVETFTKYVGAGNPAGSIIGPMTLGVPITPSGAGYYEFEVGSDVPSGANITWISAAHDLPNPTVNMYYGRNVNIYLHDGRNEIRMQYYVNDCGYSNIKVANVKIGRGGSESQDSIPEEQIPNNPCVHQYVVYPNPTSTELTIDKIEDPNNNCEPTKSKSAIKVLLYSHSTTKLVFSQNYPSSTQQIKIDTSKLSNGIYYLNIIENGENVKAQIIIVSH